MSWIFDGQRVLRTFILCAAASICALLCSCDAAKNETFAPNTIGEGYVAPAQLNLRRELTGKSANVAVLKHGDHVSIIDVRRKFVKIRSVKGVEGWVDAAQLLSADQMAALRAETARNLQLPSQGTAGVYEPLNMHIQPNRQSPALARISEGESVAVLRHQLTSKNAPPPKLGQLLKERPQPTRRRKEKAAKTLRLPPPPPAPKAPENWQELSPERIPGAESTAESKARKEAEAAARKAEELSKPVVLEDWTLVRLKPPGAKSPVTGWVLTRNLVMSIPDEVAQYAEGKRITSYFDLGTVKDEEMGVRHNWLWTTVTGQHPFDFDAWRVFLWNRRRHRYETSFRQRDVEGYYPVRVDPPGENSFGSTFHLVTKDADEKMRTRTYFFDGTRVHLTGTEDYRPGQSVPSASAAGTENTGADKGWLNRQWQGLRKRFSRAPQK